MNALLRSVLSVVLLAGAAVAPAMAQQQVVGTLHVDDGTVMTSNGGEFTTAAQDQPLHVGDRIMVSENGKAHFTYNSGVVLHYESPGVYTVALAPAETGVASAAASPVGSVAVILGAALIGALALDSMDNVKADRPISH